MRAVSPDAAVFRFFPPEKYAPVLVGHLNSPYGIALWNELRESNNAGEVEAFRDVIDRGLSGVDGRGQLESRERIRAHIAEHWSPVD